MLLINQKEINHATIQTLYYLCDSGKRILSLQFINCRRKGKIVPLSTR